MSKFVLYILLLVSFKLVLVESQSCDDSADCEQDGNCCRDGFCTTQCDDSCHENSECDSRCCKDNKCQATDETCSRTDHYAASTPDVSNGCHYDCGDYGECCIKGECRSCYHSTRPRGYPFDNVNYDEQYGSSKTTSFPTIAFVFVVFLVGILKCIFWLWCCSYRSRNNVRRRTAYDRVLLLENDELQREGVPARRPPARRPPTYQPRPFQSHANRLVPAYTPKFKIKPKPTSVVNNGDTNEYGVQQGHGVIQPPPRLKDLVSGHGEQTNDAPQGASTDLPSSSNLENDLQT